MNFYRKLVEKKVRVEELIFTLEKIINKYKDIGVNLTTVREKLLALKAFKRSKDHYERLEKEGASLDERIAALNRILNKFTNIDADLSGMEKELEQLQEKKVSKVKEPEKIEQFRVEKETAPPSIEAEFKEGEMSGSKIKKDFKKTEKIEESKENEDLEEFEEFRP